MFKLILAFLISTSSAALTPSDIAKTPIRNALLNPGAENGKVGWAVSTGSFTASNSTPLDGNASFVWDASASTQTLSSAITVPEWLKGQNAVVSCQVRCATGTCTHSIRALVAGVSVAASTITSSTTASPRATVNFIAPTSGAIGVELYANANEPSLKIDNCYIARADEWNLSQVSQASLYGTLTYAATTNCQFPNTNSTYTDFPADTDCPTASVTGFASAPATKIPGITFSTLPPGDYLLMVSIQTSAAGGPSEIGYRWSDGTSASSHHTQGFASSSYGTQVVGRFSYTTAQSNLTFRLQGYRTGGTSVQIGVEVNPFQVHVYRFPSSSETAVKVDSLPASWSGYHSNNCTYSRSGASLGEFPADATCDFVEQQNVNFGTVTSQLSGSDKLPGIVFTPRRTGRFLVLSNFSGLLTSGGTSSVYELWDGTNSLGNSTFSSPANEYIPHTLLGVFNATSTSAVTIRIRGAAAAGDIRITGPGSPSTSHIRWTIIALDQSFPAPLLVGSVTSGSAGLIRVEHAVVGTTNRNTGCNTGTCTIFDASSSWLSATRSATGTYSYIMSGFTGVPVCTCSPNRQASVHVACAVTSSTNVSVLTANATATDQDEPVSIRCSGPR